MKELSCVVADVDASDTVVKYRPPRRRAAVVTEVAEAIKVIVYTYSLVLFITTEDLLETEPDQPRPLVMSEMTIVMTSFDRASGVEKLMLTEMTDVTIVDVDAVAEIEFDGVAPGAELVVDAVGEFVGDARFDIDSEGYVDCEGVIEAVTPRVLVVVGVPLGVFEDDGVGVSDAVVVAEADVVGVLDAVAPRVSDDVVDGVGVVEVDGVRVPDGVPVEENEGVTVAVGVDKGVPPDVSVVVVVLVEDFVGVPVEDGVVVVVPDFDVVGVPVDDPVTDGVCVRELDKVLEVVADSLFVLVIV